MHLRNLLWIFPFICFIGGYITLDKLYTVKELETPALVGKTINQTFIMLSDLNLNSRLMGNKEDPTLPEGTIISQSPQAGQRIKQNQSVFLVISTHPQKIATPNFIGKTKESIDADLAKLNIRAKSYFITSKYPKGQCLAQIPEPGELLEQNKMDLYLSDGGNNQMLMPNFKGKLIKEVKESDAIKFYSSKVDISHRTSPEQPHNCENCIIIDQRPLPGSILAFNPEKPLPIQLLTQ